MRTPTRSAPQTEISTLRHLQQEAGAILDPAAIVVGALVGAVLQKLVGQVPVRAVNLDWKRRPKMAPTSPLVSERIGKLSLFCRTDFRLFGGVCGEIATSNAPNFSNSGFAASSACSSMLQ
jgi:hypothetical protein